MSPDTAPHFLFLPGNLLPSKLESCLPTLPFWCTFPSPFSLDPPCPRPTSGSRPRSRHQFLDLPPVTLTSSLCSLV